MRSIYKYLKNELILHINIWSFLSILVSLFIFVPILLIITNFNIESENWTHIKENLLTSYIFSTLYLILGVGIPVIVVSLRDFLNETILSKSDLTKITNIPIIGVIGNSDNANNLVVLNNPKSVISESFRSLRTNIQYLSSEIENKVVTITSSVGSEGKTFCTSNLALIMASAGYKTILIGADLRKPKTHEVFNIDNSI